MAASVVFADQFSKYLVTSWLEEGQSWDMAPWLAPVFRITHVTNTGAVFGLFRGWGDIFIVITVVVILAIFLYSHNLPGGQWLMRMVLGLQLGGAVGNLVDRLRQGFVVDFIDLNFWPLHEWPVFNLADASIVAGVALLALLMIWEERRERRTKRAAGDG
jgi:signal peptidase II